MDDKLLARREGLREQTIIIEDCTAELKRLINKSVFSGTSVVLFLWKAFELIDEKTDEITEEDLKISARTTLKSFARVEFTKLRATLTSKAGFSFVALFLVKKIFNSESAKDKQEAYERLQFIEPRFQNYQPVFAPGKGRSWRWGVPLNEYMKSYMSKVDEAARLLANDSVKDIDGLPLRLKSELYVRQQFHIEEMKNLRENNIEYVWISSHENCSPRCQPNQGRLYSMNGTNGVLDGIPYRPIEAATNIYVTTKKGKVYKNGTLSGFGCRHYTIPYERNGTRPPKLSDERVERAWAIEKEQRRLERAVFHLREKYYAFQGNNDVLSQKYYKAAANKKDEYIEFCRENDIAWYPSRIRVDP